jgi:hypothetical protein
MNCVRHFAVVLLFALTTLSCFSSAQTSIYVGQCSNYTWQDDCSGANNANLCPSSGSGSCNMVISDVGGIAVATQQGSLPSDYICVGPSTTINWAEGTATESFVVDFGTSTPFSNNEAIFTGKAGTNASGSIVSTTSSVPECNEYVILHCDSTSCTMGDPVVVVHGGLNTAKHHPGHDKKSRGERGSKDQ